MNHLQNAGCLGGPVNHKSKAHLDVLRARKSQSQKRLRAAVAGEEAGGGKEKKKQRNGHAEKLPEVSRVEVEEVGWSSASHLR